MVLFLTTLALVGWATRLAQLTRFHPAWPPMTPWTALWLAPLGAAILLQSSTPSLSSSVGAVVAWPRLVGVISHDRSSRSTSPRRTFGIDQMWFGEAVRAVAIELAGSS